MAEHPITPPPELVQQWAAQLEHLSDQVIFSEIAQWGADQELEACCEWLEQQTLCGHQDLIPSLRADRRPKPPSLKQQAVDALHGIIDDPNTFSRHIETIRRALEALPE